MKPVAGECKLSKLMAQKKRESILTGVGIRVLIQALKAEKEIHRPHLGVGRGENRQVKMTAGILKGDRAYEDGRD